MHLISYKSCNLPSSTPSFKWYQVWMCVWMCY